MAERPIYDPATDPMMHHMGFIRVLDSDAEAGRISIEFEAKQVQCHSGNIVQGGYVAGWIDNVMATAVSLKTNYELVPLSLDIKIAFYGAANPGIVVAEGWTEKMGRRTAFAEGLLRTREGRIIAKGMSTLALKPMAR
jgi:uncharacterized protein (TIGR00369 family)